MTQIMCLIVVKYNRKYMQDWVVRGESYSRPQINLVSLQPVAFLVTIDSQLHQREFIFIYTIQRSYNEI